MAEAVFERPGAWRRPTRLSGLTLGAKMAVFQARRALVDLLDGPDTLSRAAGEFPSLAGESVSPLYGESDPRERALELGKAHNLATAAAALDGLVLTPGRTFSFWRQVGRATRARGYRVGRMLREGCLVPAVGGGLCQLSTALYEAALTAGCQIVERHAHSRIVPGSIAERTGRDATVAWNYVDLRFSSRGSLKFEVAVTDEALVVRLWASAPAPAGEGEAAEPARRYAGEARSCASCDETACAMHGKGRDGEL